MNAIDETDFARLRDSMHDRLDRDTRSRTTRHRIVVGVAALTIALGTTGGALAVARASQRAINYSVECYGAADLGSRHGTSVFGPGQRTDATPLVERIALAEDQCAGSWRVGAFEKDHAATTRQDLPVPPLTTCELPDGRLAVFPSSRSVASLCSDLGLAIPQG